MASILKDGSLRKEWAFQAGILVLALSVRLVYLFQSAANPTFATPIVDSGVYDLTARMMAAGKDINYYNNFFWQPPFYPFFLALVYALFHGSILWAKLFQALLGGVCCLLTYRLGEIVFSRTAAVVAGVITALYGPLIFFEQELLACGWAVFWSLALVLLVLSAGGRGRWWTCFLLGCCGALSILNRPVFLPVFTILVIWLAGRFYRQKIPRQRTIRNLFLVLAGFSLVALPAALANRETTGHFGIMPATGGINFFIGNNPDFTGTITARPGRDWRRITNLPGRNGVTGNMWDEQQYFMDRFKAFVRDQPLVFLRGLAHKTVQFFSSREIPRNIDIYLFREWSGLMGVLVWKIKGFGFPFGVLLPLTLTGLVGCRRQIPAPLKIILCLYPLLLILIFVTARYRIPLIPIMSVIAAGGLLKLVDMIRTVDRRGLATTGIGIVAVVLLSTLPGPFPEEQTNFQAEMYAGVGEAELRRGLTDPAIAHLDRALALKYDSPSAHGNLGMALTRKGRYEQAIRHFNIALELDDSAAEVHNNLAFALVVINKPALALEHYTRAITLNPDYPEARYNLGNLLLSLGRTDEAVNQFKQALRIDPDFFEAHNSLAVALSRKGDFEGAVRHFREAVRLQPREIQPRFNLAVALGGSGRTDAAIDELRMLLNIESPPPDVFDYLARLLTIKAQADADASTEAVMAAAKACRLTGYRRPEFLGTLAEAYAAAGDFPRAAAVAEKALRISSADDDNDGEAYFQKRLEYYRAKIKG